MNLASRASRLGLTVAILRILCNGLCTAQRFYVEGVEQRCRVGCLDESDSLPHYSECPLLYKCFTSVWRHATIFQRRGHLFHDLITQNFLRSLQYGIVVMGVLDAFVYAHNHHSRNIDNPGNLGACIKGRIRFMTAITPAYAHAYQFICVAGHIPAASLQNFACRSRKPDIHIFPTLVPQHAKKAMTFMDGPSTLTVVLALLMVKLQPDGVLSHDLSIRSTSCICRCQDPFRQCC